MQLLKCKHTLNLRGYNEGSKGNIFITSDANIACIVKNVSDPWCAKESFSQSNKSVEGHFCSGSGRKNEFAPGLNCTLEMREMSICKLLGKCQGSLNPRNLWTSEFGQANARATRHRNLGYFLKFLDFVTAGLLIKILKCLHTSWKEPAAGE